MPLTDPSPRRAIHQRQIDMKAYARDDGLFDVEARLVDTKPFAFRRFASTTSWPAGEPLHDLRIRLTVDARLVVRAVEASSDATPFAVCKGAEDTLAVLVGERIARGWSGRVKELLRGAASCTHLMEMLIPLGTAALQGIGAVQRQQQGDDIAGSTGKIDSCYAYARHGEVVQRLWPQHWRPAQDVQAES